MSKKEQSSGPPDTWLRALEFDAEFAVKHLIERGKFLPTFVLYLPGQKVMLIPAGWTDDTEKQRMMALVSVAAVAHDALAISLSTEAWMRTVARRDRETDAEHNKRARAVPPSEAQDRQEIIITVLTYRDDADQRHSLSQSSKIIRDAAGQVTGATAMDFSGSIEGAMTDILPPCRAPAYARDAARAMLAKNGVTFEALATTIH